MKMKNQEWEASILHKLNELYEQLKEETDPLAKYFLLEEIARQKSLLKN